MRLAHKAGARGHKGLQGAGRADQGQLASYSPRTSRGCKDQEYTDQSCANTNDSKTANAGGRSGSEDRLKGN